MCAKFQLDWYMHLCSIAKKMQVCEMKKKIKKQKQRLDHISGLAGVITWRAFL